MSQLFDDCLNEIFEYLGDDITSLHSCLLVNRLWCKVSVRILWRNSWNYSDSTFDTLIACLPSKSKEILYKNKIIILTPISKPPMFNYTAFCKVLSIEYVHYTFLLRPKLLTSCNNVCILSEELFKMFMEQITSLKELYFFDFSNITLTSYSGAKDCLRNLSELHCSNVFPDFFYQLSKICHNISSLNIIFKETTMNGLTDLISVQQNLKYLSITKFYNGDNLSYIIPSLTENLSDSTLIKLRFNKDTPLLFITNFKNLQELEFSVNNFNDLKDYEKLENFNFPQLQILKIPYPYKFLIKFLEINGKHLKEIYISDSKGYNDNSINLSIANFCTKIRKLSTGFKYNELDTLKLVFNNCQCLESIKLWCGSRHLSEKEALKMVMKFSHDNLCEIILSYESDVRSSLLPEEFESFLIYWKNCVSRKSLSLIIVNLDYKSLDKNVENTKLIDKYIKLGVIKKFKVTNFEDAEFSHNYYNKVQQILCR